MAVKEMLGSTGTVEDVEDVEGDVPLDENVPNFASAITTITKRMVGVMQPPMNIFASNGHPPVGFFFPQWGQCFSDVLMAVLHFLHGFIRISTPEGGVSEQSSLPSYGGPLRYSWQVQGDTKFSSRERRILGPPNDSTHQRGPCVDANSTKRRKG